MWRSALAELRGRPDFAMSDVALLERLVLNRMAADNALAQAEADPYVEGSTGQLVAHPGYAVAARCDGVAISLARQLRLSPMTRDAIEAEEDDVPASTIDEIAKRRGLRAAS